MLMVAGRLRVFGLALGSSLLLGAVPCLTAEETAESSSAAEAKPASPPAAEAGVVAPQTPDAPPASASSTTHASHRRRTAEPSTGGRSSRRAHGPSVTELPVDRLRQHWSGDVNLPLPARDRATLTEVIRRLAGWSDSCPLCGKACPLCGKVQVDQDQELVEAVTPPKASTDHPALGQIGRGEPGDEALGQPLRAGEPAQVILDTQKRLGKSVLDGTEFGGSPELLIQWIRALDEENRRQQAMLEEVSRADVDELDQEATSVSGQSQIEALRSASRQLQEAAELLEEQNLFESADAVRAIADSLRRQSRQKVGGLEARRPSRRATESDGEANQE
ncbi:MAG TPA: hypothetical protein VG826_17890 [Pirellulales bacterium]|nr:hypothetical protein [Pirellulales bacterium]